MSKNNNKTIQFLLRQLATNEQDRKRFNLFSVKNNDTEIEIIYHNQADEDSLFLMINFTVGSDIFSSTELIYSEGETDFHYFPEIYKQHIIRTCLSRVNGKAVLRMLEGDKLYFRYNKSYNEITSEELYNTFDYPLRNGKPLNTAIQSLHDKMLELVPEYQKFLNL